MTKFIDTHDDLYQQSISTLIHDLRTPLTSAKMAAQLILRRPEDVEKNQIFANKIVKSIDRMNKMIEELLNTNCSEPVTHLDLKMSPCDFRHITLNALRDLGVSFDNHFLFNSELEKSNGYSNEEAFRRMIENLVNNAVKYGSPKELITVVLKQNKNQIQLIVNNIGNPIPISEQGNLFQPFHRTRSAKNGRNKGWGLGLAMVKNVAEAHGGSVSVQSNERDGTSFIVTVPNDAREVQ